MSGIFGGSQPQQQIVQPAAPTAVAPPPDRSDAETSALAARQKARFSRPGSFTNNYFGNGGSSGVSTTARTLGGTQ